MTVPMFPRNYKTPEPILINYDVVRFIFIARASLDHLRLQKNKNASSLRPTCIFFTVVGLWFFKLFPCLSQVINNACATQAVISLLLNCEHPDLELGPELTKLKEFSRSFDPKMRGLALSNSQTIRAAHNSMAQQHMFEVADHPRSTVSKRNFLHTLVKY